MKRRGDGGGEGSVGGGWVEARGADRRGSLLRRQLTVTLGWVHGSERPRPRRLGPSPVAVVTIVIRGVHKAPEKHWGERICVSIEDWTESSTDGTIQVCTLTALHAHLTRRRRHETASHRGQSGGHRDGTGIEPWKAARSLGAGSLSLREPSCMWGPCIPGQWQSRGRMTYLQVAIPSARRPGSPKPLEKSTPVFHFQFSEVPRHVATLSGTQEHIITDAEISCMIEAAVLLSTAIHTHHTSLT
jgi:hypothetical protein